MGRLTIPAVVFGVNGDPATIIRPAGRVVHDVAGRRLRLHDGATPGGLIIPTANTPFESTFDPDAADAAGWILNGDAISKDFDVLQLKGTVGSGRRINLIHAMLDTEPGSLGGQAGGFAVNGNGKADAGVFNCYEAVDGSGVVAAKVGTGPGWAGDFRFSSTGAGGGVLITKQEPVTGVAGTGPALQVRNNSLNGLALLVQSDEDNADPTTASFERGNGKQGTGLLVRALGGGVRTGLVIGAQFLISPSVASTGAGAVYGVDIQLTGNVTGSANSRGLSLTNSATGGAEGAGLVLTVDGVNTDNYALFLQAANATGKSYGIYVAAGIARFNGIVWAPNLPVHADNAAAVSAGMEAGQFYVTAAGAVMARY